MASWYPGNFDAVIGNLFPQLMLTDIHVFEFGNERWQVFGKQSDCLLIVAIDYDLMIKLKSNVFEKPIPSKGFGCRVRQSKQFRLDGWRGDRFLLNGDPIDGSTEELK